MASEHILALAFLFVLCLHVSAASHERATFEEKYIVHTDCGSVEGKKYVEHSDKSVKTNIYEFRNIPYALPPIGPLRWRPPVRLSKNLKNCWKGVFKYDKKVVACKQNYPRDPSLETTEDCLVLTVRTPSIDSIDNPLPVMVWIHGGGMVWGYNEMYAYHPDTEFTAYMNVVTVSINYRLNLFGFLSLKELWLTKGENRSYGNYGLMDQIEALRWVKDNIRNFGGDPGRVTIYGESGGGTAVYCLLSSPLAKGLFQKASPASGAPHIRTTHIQADKEFRVIMNETYCNATMSSKDILDCLQKVPAEKYLEISQKLHSLTYHSNFPVNVPYKGIPIEILDPVVVTYSPDTIPLDSRHDVPMLIGNCAQEIGPNPDNKTPDGNLTTWKKLQQFLEPRINTFEPGLYPDVLQAYLMDHKMPPATITPRYIFEIMASDVLLICTTNDVSQHLARLPGTAVTRFIVSQPPSKEIGLGVETAYHGWDSVALFGLKFYKGLVIPEPDKNLMLDLRILYKDFMHSRFPQELVNKTIDFWKGSHNVQPLGQYHHTECEIWREYGFLEYSWGNLGLKNDI